MLTTARSGRVEGSEGRTVLPARRSMLCCLFPAIGGHPLWGAVFRGPESTGAGVAGNEPSPAPLHVFQPVQSSLSSSLSTVAGRRPIDSHICGRLSGSTTSLSHLLPLVAYIVVELAFIQLHSAYCTAGRRSRDSLGECMGKSETGRWGISHSGELGKTSRGKPPSSAVAKK